MTSITKQQSLDAGKALRPRDIADVVGKYIKEGNMEGIMSMFHEDCVVHFPPAPLTVGPKLIGELFTPFVASGATLTSSVTNELIVGDSALLQADWKLESKEGVEMSKGSSTEVAKQKPDGSWVYYIDCPFGPPTI